MSTPKRVGIDVDDVLADFVPAFRQICHEKYGTPLDLQPNDWAWTNFGLTPKEIAGAWDVVRATPNFWANLNKAGDAHVSAMHSLINEGNAKPFFITSRFDTAGWNAERQTAWWLNHYFHLAFPTAIVGTPKGLTAKALGLTHFIDDRDVNCLDVLNSVPGCQVFIKDTSHNQHFQHDHIQRVKNFNEFALIVGAQN